MASIKDIIQSRYLGLPDVSEIKTSNVFNNYYAQSTFWQDNPELVLLDLMRKPDYLPLAAKCLLGVDILPFQHVILRELWIRPFPMLIATRGGSKSFILALYACLKMLLHPGSRIVITGAAFRQAKIIFGYMETFYYNSPIFKSIVPSGKGTLSGPRRDTDTCVFYCGDSTTRAIPMGTGEKIRGLRANSILTDEFSSIPVDIYQTVVAGFGSVALNPVASFKENIRQDTFKKLKIDIEEKLDRNKLEYTNQSVLSGTAFYDFNHFADYFRQYKTIIQSKGDPKIMKEIFQDDWEEMDWRDFSIIRLPYNKLPKGFMDLKQINRARATNHIGIFQMEYGGVFSKDSTGFFKRSIIESATASEKNKIMIGNEPVIFRGVISGHRERSYIFGIDPAAENDNFSICILEVYPDHRRIVYVWTTNKQRYTDSFKAGQTKIDDYFAFCTRKIRDLMSLFKCERIVLDPGGGGATIAEHLHSELFMKEGEPKIWPIVDDEKEKETDYQVGEHILQMFNYHKTDDLRDANNWLRSDIENKILLFPFFDPLSIELALEDDKRKNREYDTLEDCVLDIEELKNELCTIVVTKTAGGRQERWDTPDAKTSHNKKGKMRKDRYSALMMANFAAYQKYNMLNRPQYTGQGSVASNAKQNISGDRYISAPQWVKDHEYFRIDPGMHLDDPGGSQVYY